MKKRTKRKIYPLVNPISHAIEGARITDANKLSQLRKMELDAIDAFRHGVATQAHWQQVNDMASIAELMSLDGIGIEVNEVAKQAEAYLLEAVLQFRKTGVMQVEAKGVATFHDLQEYHDLQRQLVARSEYWLFIKRVIDLRTGRSPFINVV